MRPASSAPREQNAAKRLHDIQTPSQRKCAHCTLVGSSLCSGLLKSDLPKLQKYELLEKLGEGGMGAVHLARREGSAEICVIKQLRAEIAEDKIVGHRFLREAQISSLLVHPHIARLSD